MPCSNMTAELYTTSWCPFCIRAKQLLEQHSVEYQEHVMDDRDAELEEVKARHQHYTVPIVLLDGQFVGGCDELMSLAARGELSGPASG